MMRLSCSGTYDVLKKQQEEARKNPYKAEPVVDTGLTPTFGPETWAKDRGDVVAYTLAYAPYIGLAGALTGLQEAYFKFERMPDVVARQSLKQAYALSKIVGSKYLYASALGAVFCATEALVENQLGKHDYTSGMVAAVATGVAYAAHRPWPQPFVWPLIFTATVFGADMFSETIPRLMRGFKYYGAIPGREGLGDPEPPRPPIRDTGASNRPFDSKHSWRGG
ncbi:MAG: hypothetical protein WDW36_006992 [Sanguina aurantia]